MRPEHPSSLDHATAATRRRPDIAPPPAPAGTPNDEWDKILLTAFGPRHWNLGCG